MAEIRELDEQTVERIAAGEVVERPASAVKELVENSLDADASRVTVAVEAGGTESIRVTDDGVGMGETQLRRAVEKHTTSKIRDIDDLEGGVGTLGFRGEALHAIGAVSRLTVRSRPREGGQGTELTVEGCDVTAVGPVGCPAGTTVEVQDLFYNVPARRKYLKTEATEFSHVSTVVTNYALANPDVAVTLEHDGRELFATTGGSLREAVMSVYGREVAENMIPVEEDGDGPLQAVSGLVSHPETNRSSREYLSTFVNGRYVTASTVRKAVVDAYGGQLAGDRYPFAALFLAVDPATVDVNVHPRKREVRFADDEGVGEQVRSAVESALLDAGLVRSSAPRGRSAAEQTEIRPGGAENAPEEGDSTGESADESASAAGTTAADDGPRVTDAGGDDADGTAGRQHTRNPASTESPAQPGSPAKTEQPESPGQSGSTDKPDDIDASGTTADTGETTADGSETTATEQPASVERENKSNKRDTGTVEPRRDPAGRKFRGGGKQARLGEGDPSTELTFDSLPAMRVLGQFRETYVVAETEDGLVLVDQHAADERVNYERLQESVAGGTTTQALAEPVRLELTAREAELFEAHADALARLGFHASLVEDRVVEVSTVPALVAETEGPELVRDVVGALVEGDVTASETVEAAVDELLADLACYPSVTGNTSLTEGSVLDLLERLDSCENPYACPHGRPVVVELADEDIEARFERDYPGH